MRDLQLIYRDSIRTINHFQIECFLCAARMNTITGAAAALNTTQSTVTRSIQAVEEKTGLMLLIRHSNGVQLTPAGQILFEHWEKAEEIFVHGWEMAFDSQNQVHGQLNLLSLTFTKGRELLLPALKRFAKLHSEIVVHVDEKMYFSPTLIENGQFDAAIVPSFYGDALVPQSLQWRVIYELPTKVYMHILNPLAENEFFDISCFEKETIILIEGWMLEAYTKRMIRSLERRGIYLKQIIYCDSLIEARIAVSNRKGIFIGCDLFMFEGQDDDIVGIPIKDWLSQEIVIWKKTNKNVLLEQFLKCI